MEKGVKSGSVVKPDYLDCAASQVRKPPKVDIFLATVGCDGDWVKLPQAGAEHRANLLRGYRALTLYLFALHKAQDEGRSVPTSKDEVAVQHLVG